MEMFTLCKTALMFQEIDIRQVMCFTANLLYNIMKSKAKQVL